MFWFGKAAKEKMRLSILNDIENDERLRKEALDEQERLKRVEMEEDEKSLRDSDEPWVVVRAMVEDEEQGATIELDWNVAFITYLKKNGITGADDDTIIQKYIMMLLKDMTDSLSADQVSSYE